jgi:hypothetical protein
MPFRHDTIKARFAEAIPPLLEPGETVQAQCLTQTGPNPWLAAIFGWIGMLLAGVRYRYVVVTDRRVLFLKASLLNVAPRGPALAHPRAGVSVGEAKMTKTWNHAKYRGPDGGEIRLHANRPWKADFEGLLTALGAGQAQTRP